MKYYACLLFLFFTFFSIYSFYGQDKKIDSLKAIIVKSNLTTEKVNSYILWSDLLVNINNTEIEEKLLDAINLLGNKQEPKLLAKIYYKLGLIYYKKENDGLAMKYFIKSDSIFNKNNIINEDLVQIKFHQAQILKFSYTEEGLLKSKQYLNEMLDYAFILNDSVLINWGYQKMGGGYGVIAEIKNKNENQDTAVFFFTKAKNFFKKNKQYLKLNTTLWSLASIAESRGDFEKAKLYQDQRISEINNIIDSSEKGIIYKSVGGFYTHINRPKEALQFLDKADKIFKNHGFPNSRDQIEMYSHQAKAYLK